MANKVKALQQWCKHQVDGYRDVSVTNMTSSWRSGLAFCALIHRYRPDLIDYDSLSKEDVYANNELAFRVAKESLDIPDLLEAEDMVAMAVPDKLCIVTYVSQYYNVLRNMTPGGGAGEKRSPLKRSQPTMPSDETKAKRITMENNSNEVQKNVQRGRPANKQSLGDKCHICHQKVYLMERHLEGGKLYHRHCYRESEKSSFRSYTVASQFQRLQSDNSKEMIACPTATTDTLSNGTATNGTTPSSAKSMVKLWDTKIAQVHKRSPSSLSPTSPSGTTSPKMFENNRCAVLAPSSTPTPPLSPLSSLSVGLDTNSSATESSSNEAKPKTLSVETPKVKPFRPWSPVSTGTSPVKQSPTFTKSLELLHASSPSPSSSSPSPSPSNSSSSSQQRSFSPIQTPKPLSPSAAGLFPHFNQVSPQRIASSAAPIELDSKAKHTSGRTVPPPKRPPSPAVKIKRSFSSVDPASLVPTLRDVVEKEEPAWKSNQALKSSLLTSLVSIRQRFDDTDKKDNEVSANEKQMNSISNVSSPRTPDSTRRPEQPRSILKSEDGTSRGQTRPILKYKEPVSFSDLPPLAESRPLRSILKTDFESGPSSVDTSPRSILKHHDEIVKENSPRSSHGILKTDTTSMSDSTGDSSSILRRSILKTKDIVSDSDSVGNHEMPGRSILKSRKSSGDSLLGSSGDELDELSPRPILKNPPRSESVVSPTNEPRSILKSKNLSTHSFGDNGHDSPKPILKSGESSPTRSMSPLRTSEPFKPILKKGFETPTAINSNVVPGKSQSPVGPSVLEIQKEEGSCQSGKLFAAFKSVGMKNYTSSLGLGVSPKESSITINSSSDEPVNNMNAFSKEDSIVIAKSHNADNTKVARQSRPRFEQDSSVSQLNGAKKPEGHKSLTLSKAAEEEKPVWMLEAEKRQMARKGKYVDPEKCPVGRTEIKESIGMDFSSWKPTSKVPKVNGASQSKPSTIVDAEESKPTVAAFVHTENDNRPEWQKEAEKRQAMRKGNYHDPEKGPLRPKNRPSAAKKPSNGLKNKTDIGFTGVESLGNGLDKRSSKRNISDTETQHAPLSVIEGNAASIDIDRRPRSAVPPPKPMRSPMPQRTMISSVYKREKPQWQLEAERRQAELQKRLQEHPSDIQIRKQTTAPARPSQPPQFGKQITPEHSSNSDESITASGSVSRNSQYAEIGPSCKREQMRQNMNIPADRTSKFANRPLPAVPTNQDQDTTPKRKVNAETRLSRYTIMHRLEQLDTDLQVLEKEGRILEESIRSESDDAMDEAELMISWFELVNKKNELVRKESDLMYRQRQQDLEGQHEELEYEFRCLMEKTDKTASEKIREEALLKELVETVMLRNNIVDAIEEDRIRYLEEDQEISQMMRTKGFSLKEESSIPEPTSPKSEKDKKDKKGKDKRKDKKDKSRKRAKSCVR